jgi:hypothetical protein
MLTVVVAYLHESEVRILEKTETIAGAAIIVEEVFVRGFDDGPLTIEPDDILSVSVHRNWEDEGMTWGKRHAQADNDVRDATTGMKKIQSRGQKVPDGVIKDRGEKITRRADIREAAKNEREGRKG